MKNWLKVLIRVLIAIVLYAVVTFVLLELTNTAITKNGILPDSVKNPNAWLSWTQQSVCIMGGISLTIYFLYQILTCGKMLGAADAEDLEQRKIGIVNWLGIPLHFAIVGYLGFYLLYGSMLGFLIELGFGQNYTLWLPVPVYTVVYWLLSRCLSNHCVYRYKRWQWIR